MLLGLGSVRMDSHSWLKQYLHSWQALLSPAAGVKAGTAERHSRLVTCLLSLSLPLGSPQLLLQSLQQISGPTATHRDGGRSGCRISLAQPQVNILHGDGHAGRWERQVGAGAEGKGKSSPVTPSKAGLLWDEPGDTSSRHSPVTAGEQSFPIFPLYCHKPCQCVERVCEINYTVSAW